MFQTLKCPDNMNTRVFHKKAPFLFLL